MIISPNGQEPNVISTSWAQGPLPFTNRYNGNAVGRLFFQIPSKGIIKNSGAVILLCFLHQTLPPYCSSWLVSIIAVILAMSWCKKRTPGVNLRLFKTGLVQLSNPASFFLLLCFLLGKLELQTTTPVNTTSGMMSPEKKGLASMIGYAISPNHSSTAQAVLFGLMLPALLIFVGRVTFMKDLPTFWGQMTNRDAHNDDYSYQLFLKVAASLSVKFAAGVDLGTKVGDPIKQEFTWIYHMAFAYTMAFTSMLIMVELKTIYFGLARYLNTSRGHDIWGFRGMLDQYQRGLKPEAPAGVTVEQLAERTEKLQEDLNNQQDKVKKLEALNKLQFDSFDHILDVGMHFYFNQGVWLHEQLLARATNAFEGSVHKVQRQQADLHLVLVHSTNQYRVSSELAFTSIGNTNGRIDDLDFRLHRSISTLESSVDSLKSSVDTSIKTLEGDVQLVKEGLKVVNSKLNRIDSKLDGIRDELAAKVDTLVSSIQKQLSSIEKQLSTLGKA